MKGDCTGHLVAGLLHPVGDDSQMKGDCTRLVAGLLHEIVGDDSQMKRVMRVPLRG